MSRDREQPKSTKTVTRKEFVKAGIAGILAATLAPSPALADSTSDSNLRDTLFNEGGTAQELWSIALAQAREEGSAVFFDEVYPRDVASATRVSSVTGRGDAIITVAGQPENVIAIAVYSVSSENRIISLQDAWLSCTASQVGHTYVSHTIIDSGRTLAVNYVASITNYFGFNQVLEVYAEFGPSGSARVTANWV